MAPALTVERSPKGLLSPWRYWLVKQCHLQWITLPLSVWVDVCILHVGICLRACLFVCASLLVSLIFEQSHCPISSSSSSQQNNLSQSQGRARQMCSVHQRHVVCGAITLWCFLGDWLSGRKFIFICSNSAAIRLLLLSWPFVSQSIFTALTQLSCRLLTSCTLFSSH